MKYAARLAEINGYLNDFPLHHANQAIPVDKLLEILEFAISVSWQHQMTRHRMDKSQQTIVQFLQFCECLEVSKLFLAGMVQSVGAVMKKTKEPMGQLLRTADAERSVMALVERQRTNVALNVEKETTLPTDVG